MTMMTNNQNNVKHEWQLVWDNLIAHIGVDQIHIHVCARRGPNEANSGFLRGFNLYHFYITRVDDHHVGLLLRRWLRFFVVFLILLDITLLLSLILINKNILAKFKVHMIRFLRASMNCKQNKCLRWVSLHWLSQLVHVYSFPKRKVFVAKSQN